MSREEWFADWATLDAAAPGVAATMPRYLEQLACVSLRTGLRVGQFTALTADAVMLIGIPLAQTRSTAMFHLATELPAALLAKLLGIHVSVAVAWQRASAETGYATQPKSTADQRRIARPPHQPRQFALVSFRRHQVTGRWRILMLRRCGMDPSRVPPGMAGPLGSTKSSPDVDDEYLRELVLAEPEAEAAAEEDQEAAGPTDEDREPGEASTDEKA